MLSQLCTAHLPSEWKPLNTLENDVPHKAEGILEVSEDSLNASFRRERRSNGRGERGKEKLPAQHPMRGRLPRASAPKPTMLLQLALCLQFKWLPPGCERGPPPLPRHRPQPPDLGDLGGCLCRQSLGLCRETSGHRGRR